MLYSMTTDLYYAYKLRSQNVIVIHTSNSTHPCVTLYTHKHARTHHARSHARTPARTHAHTPTHRKQYSYAFIKTTDVLLTPTSRDQLNKSLKTQLCEQFSNILLTSGQILKIGSDINSHISPVLQVVRNLH